MVRIEDLHGKPTTLDIDFYTVELGNPLSSSYSKWPTKIDNNGRYNVTSAEIFFSNSLRVTERHTYDTLEWLGDIGGLFGMLHFLGAVILSPLIAFSLEVELLTQAFHFMPSASFAE